MSVALRGRRGNSLHWKGTGEDGDSGEGGERILHRMACLRGGRSLSCYLWWNRVAGVAGQNRKNDDEFEEIAMAERFRSITADFKVT